MALNKAASSTQWATGRKGAGVGRLVLAHDATLDQYYVASGEGADAFLVLDATDDQYTVNDTSGGTPARLISAGGAPVRIME